MSSESNSIGIQFFINRVQERSLNPGHQAAVTSGTLDRLTAIQREVKTIFTGVSMTAETGNLTGTLEEVAHLEQSIEAWIRETGIDDALDKHKLGQEARKKVYQKLKGNIRSRVNA